MLEKIRGRVRRRRAKSRVEREMRQEQAALVRRYRARLQRDYEQAVERRVDARLAEREG